MSTLDLAYQQLNIVAKTRLVVPCYALSADADPFFRSPYMKNTFIALTWNHTFLTDEGKYSSTVNNAMSVF